MRLFSWPLVSLTILSLAFNIVASEIMLKNGDRISGKIVAENPDSIVLETVYAGKVTIARVHIDKIVALPPPASAPKPVAPASTATTSANAKPTSKDVERDAPVIRSSSSFAHRVRRIVSGWDGSANIGFSYTSGNANNITMTTGLRASKVRPQDGFTIYARSLWNSNHGVQITTQNAFWGGARYDRTLNRKVFGFVSYDFERDKPRRLDFRSVVGGGLGHRTIKNDRTELELFTGAAWNRTWQAGSDSNTPEALAGFTFKHRLNDRLRVQNAVTYFQNVTDRVEYRLILDANVTVDMTKKVGFFISFGDRFNNDPLGTAKKNDFLFTTGLKWSFGKKK